jgi:hypothetical protein
MLTMLTILSTASVVTVYAVLIGTFTGGEVTVGGSAAGTVEYSLDQSTWSTTLSPASNITSWYSRLSINGGQYSGSAVTISWQLQRKVSESAWSNVGTATTTTMTLPAGAQLVYATANGQATGNRDWKADATETGTYRVLATVNSA